MVDKAWQELGEQVARAADKFSFVLELRELYQSRELFDKYTRAIESLDSSEISRSDTIRLQLGVLYLKRARGDQPANTLITQLESLKHYTHFDDRLELHRRFVEGAVRLVRERNYHTSIEILEEVEGKTRNSDDHFLYALVRKTLGDAYMHTGCHYLSEIAYQDAMTTFRRYGHKIFVAYTYNNLGVLKKKICRYSESEHLLKTANSLFRTLSIQGGEVLSTLNLGILFLKTGNWRASGLLLRKADSQNRSLIADNSPDQVISDSDYSIVCNVNYEHLLILRRKFRLAEKRLLALLSKYENNPTTRRMVALAHEFLGELYCEKGEVNRSELHLERARSIAAAILPFSDLMTEINRRIAEVQSTYLPANEVIGKLLANISLCNKIDDKLELSASLRVLGGVYAKAGYIKKSISCFECGIRKLKSINECYELMRTCLRYGSCLVEWNKPDAEIYLLQARQLCKKLELDYYLAAIDLETAKLEIRNGNFLSARDRLLEATRVCETLQQCDQSQLKRFIKKVEQELEHSILKTSVSGAEEVKAICRVYEEARFPIRDMKPDLSYQLARSVAAESLFLVSRKGRGYSVPLAYNIPINEAKEIVRRLDRNSKGTVLAVDRDPKVYRLHTGQSLVCSPTSSEAQLVLCACFGRSQVLSPRQFELLLVGADAIERLIDSDKAETTRGCEDYATVDDECANKHPRGSFKNILTVTPDMIKLIRLAERASLSQETILLEGETGVGKELFATAIHDNSRRKDTKFIAINAGGMPVNLLESQLFGHVQGAFTDAVRDRVGLIEDASSGTVFLDEVGEMGPELQVKLLRLLENGEYRRLGENQTRIADVRVISATNRDLLSEVERGRFRRDLYYRLGTVKLYIPPLRFRQRDIELLTRHFLRECSKRYQQPNRYFEIDVKAMEALELYDWPGNIRELQNEIRRVVSLIGNKNVIRFEMLSRTIIEYLKSKRRAEGLLERSVERYERRLILEALNRNDWNRLRAAEELGLPRTTLLAKMRRLDVAAR